VTPDLQAIEDRKEPSMNPLEAAELLRQDADEAKKDKVMKRPASSKPAGNQKTSKAKAKATVKAKAKAKGSKSKKASSGHAVPSDTVRLKLKPAGCSKCRNKPGCTPSCWAGRSW
jgi:hypothetical protein